MKYLSEETFEEILLQIMQHDTIDLRKAEFADPYGMVGILEGGRHLSGRGVRKTLLLPESGKVLQYLERMDFFKYAQHYFHIEPGATDLPEKFLRSSRSDVLLEITPIEKSGDIHFIVERVKQRASAILAKHLLFTEHAIYGFIVALSEVCQNILEHSENTGFVGIQKYRFQKQDRNVVKIAVMDLGIGFRESLSERFPAAGDMEAVEQALLHGVSRHRDKGRGHGLAAVRRFVIRWHGKISIRSGTAKCSIIPEWTWGRQREDNLARFPGTQIHIMLPEVV
ncbi:MAG: sensor histidine kinase [Nitrospiraceae bacterium]|nr:MAG: sensor histidine kinase [Nitrospiraceae bacterium]